LRDREYPLRDSKARFVTIESVFSATKDVEMAGVGARVEQAEPDELVT